MSEGAFRHEALFYAGRDSFLAGALPFIREAVAADQPVLVALDDAKIRLLKSHLNGEAGRVRFLDMHEVGRNPGVVIAIWKDFVAESARHGGCRGIGESAWPERSLPELAECDHHEALLNLAFEDGPAWQLMCPYDAEHLGSHVLAAARHNHPTIDEDGEQHSSRSYLNPVVTGAPFTGTLSPAPKTAEAMAFESPRDLKAIRRFVAERVAAAGLDRERQDGLVLAVDEVVTNALRHGGAGGAARLWQEPDRVVCEVEGAGKISDPLAGRLRPSMDRPDGRGLWIANNFCDLLQIRSSAAGTVVRCHLGLPGAGTSGARSPNPL
jgi:anti-sigma regulatory factor (Ser/Thr protein kinase)